MPVYPDLRSLFDLRGRAVLMLAATLALPCVALAQGPPAGPGGQVQAPQTPMMQASPILNAIDVNHDGTVTPAELANAAGRLRTLDKNADGKLTRDEAGVPQMARGRGEGPGGRGPGGPGGRGGPGGEEVETPAPGPSAADLLATLLNFDKNANGQLERAEVPDRMQAMFDRGDVNKNGILDAGELREMTSAQAAAPVAPPEQRGPGRGGFGPFDPVSTALDTDKNSEISAAEMDAAPKTLLALDGNGDGSITEDEVRPAFGGGRGPVPGGGRD